MIRQLLCVLTLCFASPAWAEVPDAARDAQVVFLGELHDNPHHHRTQAAWVAALSPRAVVFEMIEPGTAADLPIESMRDPDHLAAALDWDNSGWPDFAIYWPIFAALNGAEIVGGAVPRARTRQVFSDGPGAVMSAPDLIRFGLNTPLPPAQQEAREDAQFDAHCQAMPREMMAGMVTVQRVRDAMLAKQALDTLARSGGPVVVITGNGHARTDHGAPAALARAAPDVTIFAVGQSEDGTPPEGGFDLILDAPAAERGDPCAAFR